MFNRLLLEGKFAELVGRIADIHDPKEGVYLLYATCELESLNEDTHCAVILSLYDDEDDFVPEIARDKKLQDICDIGLIERVIKMAYRAKPTATVADIIYALSYYIDYDTFTRFE
jgi:hypothetical protein